MAYIRKDEMRRINLHLNECKLRAGYNVSVLGMISVNIRHSHHVKRFDPFIFINEPQ